MLIFVGSGFQQNGPIISKEAVACPAKNVWIYFHLGPRLTPVKKFLTDDQITA
jgi:hypothetical protein